MSWLSAAYQHHQHQASWFSELPDILCLLCSIRSSRFCWALISKVLILRWFILLYCFRSFELMSFALPFWPLVQCLTLMASLCSPPDSSWLGSDSHLWGSWPLPSWIASLLAQSGVILGASLHTTWAEFGAPFSFGILFGAFQAFPWRSFLLSIDLYLCFSFPWLLQPL